MKKINAVLIIVLLLTLAQTIFSFVDLVELYTQAESKAEHMNLTKHNDVTIINAYERYVLEYPLETE